MARNQARISVGIGAAPVMAISVWSSPSSARTPWKATWSRKSQVSISSCDAVPRVIFSMIGNAASTASSKSCSFSGSAARARVDAGVDLLPHPWDAEEQVRVDLRAVAAICEVSGQQVICVAKSTR